MGDCLWNERLEHNVPTNITFVEVVIRAVKQMSVVIDYNNVLFNHTRKVAGGVLECLNTLNNLGCEIDSVF